MCNEELGWINSVYHKCNSWFKQISINSMETIILQKEIDSDMMLSFQRMKNHKKGAKLLIPDEAVDCLFLLIYRLVFFSLVDN